MLISSPSGGQTGAAVSFLETIESARAFLERNGRVSLRVLKLEFGLNDDQTEALVAELVDVQQVAALEGKVESPRVYRRLHSLRGWSHGKKKQVFPRGPRASGSDALRARDRVRL